jgi:hypothetical protein
MNVNDEDRMISDLQAVLFDLDGTSGAYIPKTL